MSEHPARETRLTIFAAGSRGDIQPCLALGKALQADGYQVRLAAPENFAAFIQQHGVEFWPLHGDVQQIMAGESGRSFMESGSRSPLKSITTMRSLLAPVVMQMAHDALQACRDAQALICLGVFSAFGQAIAAALRIPLIQIEPTPLLPTRAFAAPSWPWQGDLGPALNYFSGLVMLRVVWLWQSPFVNDFRRGLGLPPTGFSGFHRRLRAAPMLAAYSPAIIPPAPDWPPGLQVTGYLFLEDQAAWQPPPALLDFLAQGQPPVYIGFGSMAGRSPQQLTGLVSQALAQSGQRGVLLAGWGGLEAATAPTDLYMLDAAPHSWLFPRMAALVHHGGAGTTAEGLRAGVPGVIVPFIFDQPFWAARLQAAGLGMAPLPHKSLTPEKLAAAISRAVSDPDLRRRAQACGQAIRAEDGAANAVRVVRQALEEAQAPERNSQQTR
jgi:UDP:flavonoid glycosyltransferase YjiC (YdhE family)